MDDWLDKQNRSSHYIISWQLASGKLTNARQYPKLKHLAIICKIWFIKIKLTTVALLKLQFIWGKGWGIYLQKGSNVVIIHNTNGTVPIFSSILLPFGIRFLLKCIILFLSIKHHRIENISCTLTFSLTFLSPKEGRFVSYLALTHGKSILWAIWRYLDTGESRRKSEFIQTPQNLGELKQWNALDLYFCL